MAPKPSYNQSQFIPKVGINQLPYPYIIYNPSSKGKIPYSKPKPQFKEGRTLYQGTNPITPHIFYINQGSLQFPYNNPYQTPKIHTSSTYHILCSCSCFMPISYGLSYTWSKPKNRALYVTVHLLPILVHVFEFFPECGLFYTFSLFFYPIQLYTP